MISREHPLLLGSASPRRRDILSGLGIPVRIVAASIDESRNPGEAAHKYVERMARAKLATVAAKAGALDSTAALLTADTIVVLGDDVLGKPRDEDEAFELVRRLCGRTHRVFSAYAIGAAPALDQALACRVVESLVTLRPAETGELRRYAATGEGLDKAGAYAIQGIGAFLVERIEGSYTNVVGLPACEVVSDLLELGLLGAFP